MAYPKEDKERILADLRESGLTPTAFSRLPGRPAKTSLLAWLRQAERGELDVPSRKVRGRAEHRKHAPYPEATKREALSLLSKGMRPSAVARRLGASMMWQHLFGQIYERIRPASLNPTGVM